MFDIDILRKDRASVEEMLRMRGASADLSRILLLDTRRASLVRQQNQLREERNKLSKEVKGASDKGERDALIQLTRKMRDEISQVELELSAVEADIRGLLLWVPNMLSPDVPYGTGEEGNVVVRSWGEPRQFGWKPKDHVELGEHLDIIDIPRAAKVWGTRAYFLRGAAVYLELALVRFAMDYLSSEGFTPVVTPIVVKGEILEGTRHYPFFKDQIYRIEGEDAGLVGTSEIPLGAMHTGEILDEASLPIMYAGFSSCYRTEVGSGGRDVRGLIRTHHFDKVEMFVFDKPEDSADTHERMVGFEERMYQDLGIPHRVVMMCSGDLGPVAYKKYDIEFWHPSEGKYREITSCSNCTDFQSRGLDTRFRRASGGKPEYVHTLNGTAIAIGRTLVAILENYQEEDGSVTVPEMLRQHMPGGMSRIVKR